MRQRFFECPLFNAHCMSCSKCANEAVIYHQYSGIHLCHEHFLESVRKRVYTEVRKQIHLGGGERIAVAFSGGKDSTLALYLLNEIISPMRNIDLQAILVNEGISGYRNEGVASARDFCRSLDVDMTETSISKELGISIDEIARLERTKSICTYCGVFRRKLLNVKARELQADYLATGLNLDDTVQGIVMNIFRGDIEKLARMGPHNNVQEGLVPRIQPLRKIPEKEGSLFCFLEGLNYFDGECPYAHEAVRNTYRELVSKMEEEFPGTKFTILSGYDAMKKSLQKSFPPADLQKCACGEPSIGSTCKACELFDEISRR